MNTLKNKNQISARFSKHIDLFSSPNNCWTWTGATNNCGYGMIKVNSKTVMSAHRVAWILFNNSIPTGKCVLHNCDNPSCVNPAHLFIGTQSDNMRDMAAKGRAGTNGQFGETSSNSKLTNAIVLYIKQYPNYRGSCTELANKFGVVTSTISSIRHNKNWKHVKI